MSISIIYRWTLILLVAVVTSGCANVMAVKNDVDSPFFYIKPGSTLTLHQDVSIAAGQAHASFQHGKLVSGLDNYTVGCSLDVRNLGPATVSAGRFTVSRAESSQEWISHPNIMRFYRTIYLKSAEQPDVLNLTCQDWDGPLLGEDISMPEIREALGNYISFDFAQ